MKTIQPAALYWATFNYVQFRLPGQAILDIACSGSNDEAVAHWAPLVSRYEWGQGHAWAPTSERVKHELCEWGAWNSDELRDDDANWQRIVWIAAHNIAEEETPDCSEPVTDHLATR